MLEVVWYYKLITQIAYANSFSCIEIVLYWCRFHCIHSWVHRCSFIAGCLVPIYHAHSPALGGVGSMSYRVYVTLNCHKRRKMLTSATLMRIFTCRCCIKVYLPVIRSCGILAHNPTDSVIWICPTDQRWFFKLFPKAIWNVMAWKGWYCSLSFVLYIA